MRGARLLHLVWTAALAVSLLLPAEATRAAPALPPTPLDGTPMCGFADPPAGARRVKDDGVLRVASFNVLHSETDDGDASLGQRLPLLADAIAGSGADIVGAQEVTRNVAFDPAAEAPQKHGIVAQRLALAVAARTGERWTWCFSVSNPHVPLSPDTEPGGGNAVDQLAAENGNFPEAGDFSEGLAVMTRFQFEDARSRRLSPRSYEAPACISLDPFCPLGAVFDSRQVLWARILAPGGVVDVFTTHLAHGLTPLSDQTKLIQMQQAVDITAAWATPGRMPDFLLGDFNSVPGSPVLAAATDAGFVDTYKASGGVECTTVGMPSCSGGPPDGSEVYTANPARPMAGRIDYVMARPGEGCRLGVQSSAIIGNVPAARADGRWIWPSDHLGFASTVSCSPAPG